jgi:hypothetical protein
MGANTLGDLIDATEPSSQGTRPARAARLFLYVDQSKELYVGRGDSVNASLNSRPPTLTDDDEHARLFQRFAEGGNAVRGAPAKSIVV